MDYFESAADIVITYDRAIAELDAHGFDTVDDINEFHTECGQYSRYQAQDVLTFLGY